MVNIRIERVLNVCKVFICYSIVCVSVCMCVRDGVCVCLILFWSFRHLATVHTQTKQNKTSNEYKYKNKNKYMLQNEYKEQSGPKQKTKINCNLSKYLKDMLKEWYLRLNQHYRWYDGVRACVSVCVAMAGIFIYFIFLLLHE